jgi:hypothetical protein
VKISAHTIDKLTTVFLHGNRTDRDLRYFGDVDKAELESERDAVAANGVSLALGREH